MSRPREHGIQTVHIEASLRAWFQEKLNFPEKHADRVEIHWAGERFNERALAWVQPRMSSIERRGPRDGDVQMMTLTTSVGLQTLPKGEVFGLLSLLVDEVRRAVDATRRAEAMPILDGDRQMVAKCDFGPAQETRAFAQTIQVENVAIPGVDLAVLTTACEISPVSPRVLPR